nr:hypothetical protein Itr_chr08CG01820 [Ipomoea trifida]
MEASRNFEDKWKVSTKAAAAIALCAYAAASLLVAAVRVVLRRRKARFSITGFGSDLQLGQMRMESQRRRQFWRFWFRSPIFFSDFGLDLQQGDWDFLLRLP